MARLKVQTLGSPRAGVIGFSVKALERGREVGLIEVLSHEYTGRTVGRERQPGALIAWVRVDPDHRGKGIATSLYERAAREAEERGEVLVSDVALEPETKAFWEKQLRKGRATKHRSPAGTFYKLAFPPPRSLANNPNPLHRVGLEFDRAFDELEEQFPDFGDVELHEDPAAHDGDRHFAYCAGATVIAFAPETEQLPTKTIRGLMLHEMGHLLDHRYGQNRLERYLRCRLPDDAERRADAIAEAVFGERIVYDKEMIQCAGPGCEGIWPRPRGLR